MLQAFTEAIASPDRQKGRKIQPRLRQRIERADDTEEIILVVRAAQVAALRVNWNLSVDPVRLIAAAELRPRPGDVSLAYTWQRFDVYRDPDFGAAAAIYVAGVDPSCLPTLTLGDISDNGDSLIVADADVTTPGARFVRTLALVRHLDGATANDLLFKVHKEGAVTNGHIYDLLNAPREYTTTAFVDLSHGRKLPTDDKWLAAYGLKLEHLGNPPKPRRRR